MNAHRLYQLEQLMLILFFCMSIYAPLFMGVIQEDKISSGIEKRNLANFPSLPKSFKSLSEYPEKFNIYYSDHFGFREVLTSIYFKLVNTRGNQSSVEDVTIGQDGWLFLGSIKPGYQGHDDPMGDAINVNLFTNKELKDFAKSIVAIKNWLSNKGIEYVYVIAPNKHTIYFEKLPQYISKKNNKSSTDQLVEYLQKHTHVAVVDLRPSLMMEKKYRQVYYKYDTHWNQYGANVAQFEIMKTIKNFFPEKIKPFLLDNNQFKTVTRRVGDLAKFANINNIKEEMPQPVFEAGCTPVNEISDLKKMETHTMVCKTQQLNALIFRDSFFNALKPYISRHFNRSTYIWKRMNYSSLAKYVEQEKPDIVIDEVIERSLPYTLSSALFKNSQ
ncbi:MAG: hypothetical protein V3V22_03760 [Methylococcales bacterium]